MIPSLSRITVPILDRASLENPRTDAERAESARVAAVMAADDRMLADTRLIERSIDQLNAARAAEVRRVQRMCDGVFGDMGRVFCPLCDRLLPKPLMDIGQGRDPNYFCRCGWRGDRFEAAQQAREKAAAAPDCPACLMTGDVVRMDRVDQPEEKDTGAVEFHGYVCECGAEVQDVVGGAA